MNRHHREIAFGVDTNKVLKKDVQNGSPRKKKKTENREKETWLIPLAVEALNTIKNSLAPTCTHGKKEGISETEGGGVVTPIFVIETFPHHLRS